MPFRSAGMSVSQQGLGRGGAGKGLFEPAGPAHLSVGGAPVRSSKCAPPPYPAPPPPAPASSTRTRTSHDLCSHQSPPSHLAAASIQPAPVRAKAARVHTKPDGQTHAPLSLSRAPPLCARAACVPVPRVGNPQDTQPRPHGPRAPSRASASEASDDDDDAGAPAREAGSHGAHAARAPPAPLRAAPDRAPGRHPPAHAVSARAVLTRGPRGAARFLDCCSLLGRGGRGASEGRERLLAPKSLSRLRTRPARPLARASESRPCAPRAPSAPPPPTRPR